MSLTLDPRASRVAHTQGRVGSPEEVVAPRVRHPLAVVTPARVREIIAVIDPVFAAPGDDVTASVRPPIEAVEEVAARLATYLQPGEVVAATPDGRLSLRLRREDRDARPVRLQEMAYHAVEAFDARAQRDGVVDLGVGWAHVSRKQDPQTAERHAATAAEESVRGRDLQPRSSGAHVRQRHPVVSWWSASRQVIWATVGCLVVPFLALVALYILGIDLSTPLYWTLVGALSLTALGIWAECSHAVDPPQVPDAPPGPAPRATAIIPAYLPNEADTIRETIDTFLAQEYEGGLQIVLAYNTPIALDVEDELQELAQQHADLTVLKVPDSTSKAQNVNAALRVADGEFVGIFDADHHPMAGAFDRAWRWIADGADVVQGHCVIRNGDDSALARLVAVEFEQIYAVAHPGRTRLFGFGLFGGSNGYWRTSALERIRLRGSFLTEDIESSMRVLEAGGRIVNDPGLVSRELAPDTIRTLWNQRMRWAQGWFQVSIRHLVPILTQPGMTMRQRIGVLQLLGWRELYPWISLLSWPLLGFLAWRDGGLDMSSPIFLLLTLLTTVSGPLQTFAAWRLAAPEVRPHKRWFVGAALANMLFYTEFKNVVNRVAQLKQLRGEHRWVVTPRSAGSSAASSARTDQEVAA